MGRMTSHVLWKIKHVPNHQMIIWPWIGHGCPMFKLKSKNLSVSADLLGKLRISYMFLSKLPNSYAIFMQKDVLFQGNKGNRDKGCDVSYTKACCSIGLPLSQIWYHGPGRSKSRVQQNRLSTAGCSSRRLTR